MSLGWNEIIKKELGHCGEKVFIGHNVFFTNPKEVFIDDRVRIDPFCFITTALRVGSNSQICAYSMLGGGAQHTITLEGWNFIGYGSKLFCASEDYSGEHGPVNEFWGNNEIRRGNITLEKYAGIASDVILFPGVILPEGCCIGAKSLVHSKDYPLGWSVWVGNPLTFMKSRNRETVIAASQNPEFLKDR